MSKNIFWQVLDRTKLKLDVIESPDMVFKYRTWGEDSFHDNILLKNEIFYASPSYFEDVEDCRNPVRYDLLNNYEKIKWIFNLVNEDGRLTKEEKLEQTIQIALEARWENMEYLKEMGLKMDESFITRLGILSLTVNDLCSMMWEKYASTHTGICYGFDSISLASETAKSGGIISYYEELPCINPLEDREVIFFKKFYAKKIEYQLEEEYRLKRFYPEGYNSKENVLNFSDSTLKVVILGYKFPEEQVEEIKRILMKKKSIPKLFKCVMEEGGLSKKEI